MTKQSSVPLALLGAAGLWLLSRPSTLTATPALGAGLSPLDARGRTVNFLFPRGGEYVPGESRQKVTWLVSGPWTSEGTTQVLLLNNGDQKWVLASAVDALSGGQTVTLPLVPSGSGFYFSLVGPKQLPIFGQSNTFSLD